MKTKLIVATLFLTGFALNSMGQNAWKPEANNKYYIPETSVKVFSRTETYFGANFEYSAEGAKINNVIPNSPAETHQFRKGDVITSIGDITINSEESYTKAMNTYKPDQFVKISFVRKSNLKTRKVRLDKITVYKNEI